MNQKSAVLNILLVHLLVFYKTTLNITYIKQIDNS